MKLSLTLTTPPQHWEALQYPKPGDRTTALEAEGDAVLIAGYLRALADSVSPPIRDQIGASS